MIAILKREWKSYFQNITGWLFIAAVLALYGLYFLDLLRDVNTIFDFFA